MELVQAKALWDSVTEEQREVIHDYEKDYAREERLYNNTVNEVSKLYTDLGIEVSSSPFTASGLYTDYLEYIEDTGVMTKDLFDALLTAHNILKK